MKSTKTKLLVFIVIIFTFTCCNQKEEIQEILYLPNILTEYNADHDAFLSPNGQKIAFLSSRNTFDPFNSGYNFELWLMDRDGENQRLLLGSTNSNNYQQIEIIKWSEDSNHIIVSANRKDTDTDYDILKISITGIETLLFSTTYRAQNISYSPDEKMVAFIKVEKRDNYISNDNLYIAKSDFSEITRLDTSVSSCSWTNNSENLVYAKYKISNNKYENDIWKFNIKNNLKSRITSDRQRKENLRCSVSNNLLFLKNDSLFVTSLNNYLPHFIMDGPFSRQNLNWVNKRDLILLRKQQSDDEFNWLESWVIDTNGNIVKTIAPGANSIVHFSENGHYYLYTIMGFGSVGGSIWLDYLP